MPRHMSCVLESLITKIAPSSRKVWGLAMTESAIGGLQAMQEFTPEQQKAFLRFVTSCSRPPLLGFQYLDPKLCIQVGHSLETPLIPRHPS